MAFRPINLIKYKSDQDAILNPKGAQISGPQIYGYQTSEDNVATVSGGTYFLIANPTPPASALLEPIFRVGDYIWCACSDANVIMQVTVASPTNTTTIFDAVAAGTIVNADIAAAAAIAFSKLEPMASGAILVGSAGAVATEVAMSGDVAIIASGATTIQALAVKQGMLAITVPRTISIAVSSAEMLGLFASPKLILAAPSAGTYYVVSGVQYEFNYSGAQFTNGGVMGVQYDSTVNGAGELTHLGVAAAVVQGVSADWIVGAVGFNIETTVGAASAGVVAKGLYLSNKTADFDSGTTTVTVHVTFSTVTTNL